MSEQDKTNRPNLTEKARKEAEARERRLAAALRDNLRKRKHQMRERREGSAKSGRAED